MTPGVDGGHRKAYDGTVFRSESESRKDVRARARLSGEQRRVGCVRLLKSERCNFVIPFFNNFNFYALAKSIY